jgi:hypothetical protein
MIRTAGWKTTVLMRQPWVKAQNEVTYGYLNQIPFRDVKNEWRNCGITRK